MLRNPLATQGDRSANQRDVAWQLEWENQKENGATLLYLKLLKPTCKRKKLAPQLGIRRELLGWLIAARSGYGHFAAYHQRFSHEEEGDWWFSCRIYRAPLQPFGCTNARAHRALLWSEKAKRALSTEEILSTFEGAAAFEKLARNSTFQSAFWSSVARWDRPVMVFRVRKRNSEWDRQRSRHCSYRNDQRLEIAWRNPYLTLMRLTFQVRQRPVMASSWLNEIWSLHYLCTFLSCQCSPAFLCVGLKRT